MCWKERKKERCERMVCLMTLPDRIPSVCLVTGICDKIQINIVIDKSKEVSYNYSVAVDDSTKNFLVCFFGV